MKILILITIVFVVYETLSHYLTIKDVRKQVGATWNTLGGNLNEKFNIVLKLVDKMQYALKDEKLLLEIAVVLAKKGLNSNSIHEKLQKEKTVDEIFSNLISDYKKQGYKASTEFLNDYLRYKDLETEINIAASNYNSISSFYNYLTKQFPINMITGLRKKDEYPMRKVNDPKFRLLPL